jgi:hypothetical protein
MKEKCAIKDKRRLRKQMNEKFNNTVIADENIKKVGRYSFQFRTRKRWESEIQVLLHQIYQI